ncbi:hypothetical protein [Bacillus massiliigorillae]|uniref:hypothetical protein n=1 Tax=Bacillus massiliigorillae TaxID=1243664 RepID=UPI00039F95A7|nr:hypothetical protein [Bacillus massiliigorillae]
MLVRGTQKEVKEIEVGKTTVYIRKNIERITVINTNDEGEESNNYWQYDEEQYSKDEYIAFISKENETFKQRQETTEAVLSEIILGGM